MSGSAPPIYEILVNTSFIKEPYVVKFQEDYPGSMGECFVTDCANGMDAIAGPVVPFGVGLGMEAIVLFHAWASTTEAVATNGTRPVFGDSLHFMKTYKQLKRSVSDFPVAFSPNDSISLTSDVSEAERRANQKNL